MNQPLAEILGSAKTEEIKDALKGLIIAQLEDDLATEYVIKPGSIGDFGDQILEEIKYELKTEIKKMLKDQLVSRALKDFNL